MGVAAFPGDVGNEFDLLACADRALYRAKAVRRATPEEPPRPAVAPDTSPA